MRETTETASEAGAAPASAESRREHRHPRRRKGLAVGVRIALIVGLLFAALVVFAALAATRETSKPRTDPVPPLTVRAVPAEFRPVDRLWEGFGTVRSMNRASIAAEVSGRVIERPEGIEAGVPVRAGDLIVAIDPTDYRAAVERAEQNVAALRAQLEGLGVESERLASQISLAEEEVAAAERDLERTREAIRAGAGSPGEADAKRTVLRRSQRELEGLRQAAQLIPSRRRALEAQLASALADLTLARENLERTRVTSPIAGRVQSVGPRAGDYLPAGAPVAEVVDLSTVEIPLRLPASSASWLGPVIGLEGAVSLWAGPPLGPPAHVGRITRLAPEADPASRTITVFVEVRQDPDDPDRFLPGAFVQGRVRAPDPAERVLLPRRAIRAGRVMLIEETEPGVRRVRVHPVRPDYAIEDRYPELDPAETEWVVLERGTEPPPGSLVAVTALEALEQNMRVLLPGETEPPPPAETATQDADAGREG